MKKEWSKAGKSLCIILSAAYTVLQLLRAFFCGMAYRYYAIFSQMPVDKLTASLPIRRRYDGFSKAASIMGCVLNSRLFWVIVFIFLIGGALYCGQKWLAFASASMLLSSWAAVALVAWVFTAILQYPGFGSSFERLFPSTVRLVAYVAAAWLAAYIAQGFHRVKGKRAGV